MTETINTQSLADQADEIDDVEAHGLREVAAAATIGAAVVGAGGMALASAHTPAPKTPAIVQQAADDSREIAQDGTDAAQDLSGTLGNDAKTFTQHVAGSAHQVVDPRVQGASNEVHSVSLTATDLAKDATRFAAHAADGVKDSAVAVKDAAYDVASDTARRELSGVTQTTLRVVSATRSAIDQGWDMNVQAFGAKAATGGSALNPTGRVTVTNASGHVLASAKLGNGLATLHIKAIGKNETLTISYGGNDAFSAVQLLWEPPVGF